MEHDPELEPLPHELTEILRSLGGAQAPAALERRVALERTLRSLGEVEAPAELWHRVTLARLGQVEAPESLWERVQPAVDAAARTNRTLPFHRAARRSALLPVAVAAGLLLAMGLGYYVLSRSDDAPPVVEVGGDKEKYRARVTAFAVSPGELSPMIRGLAASLGAPLQGGKPL